MAEKRMFTQKIIDSDAFLEMPLSAQALYFHMNMRADDDGFVNNPRKITRYVNASEDDLKILLMKRFVIGFESGVIVIKHWRMHNTLRGDRYHPTDYQEEFSRLGIKENKAYTDNPDNISPPRLSSAFAGKSKHETSLEETCNHDGDNMATTWQPNGNHLEPQNRKGLDKDKNKDKDKDKDGISGEPGSVSPPTIVFPLNDNTEYEVPEADVREWESLYPSVDIMQELRSMRGWLLANPNKRKTRRGINRFINNWLSSEQNKGGRNAKCTGDSEKPRFGVHL